MNRLRAAAALAALLLGALLGVQPAAANTVVVRPAPPKAAILYPPSRPPKPRPVRISTYITSERLPDGTLRVCQHYMDNDPPSCVEYPPARSAWLWTLLQ